MTLDTIIANNGLDASLAESHNQYPDSRAVAAPRLDWEIAVQVLAASDAQGTIAHDLAALSIAESIYCPWNWDYAALDWVVEGSWSGNEMEDDIQAEWDELHVSE